MRFRTPSHVPGAQTMAKTKTKRPPSGKCPPDKILTDPAPTITKVGMVLNKKGPKHNRFHIRGTHFNSATVTLTASATEWDCTVESETATLLVVKVKHKRDVPIVTPETDEVSVTVTNGDNQTATLNPVPVAIIDTVDP